MFSAHGRDEKELTEASQISKRSEKNEEKASSYDVKTTKRLAAKLRLVNITASVCKK